ncbi:MAG: hypothetical protein FJ100_03690 [Deltaproteobacteria bacterium]|nr:hypothetical protein [Deltaproteobacteria bacterium]
MTPPAQTDAPVDEARARDLLAQPLAWPLVKRRRAGEKWAQRFGLFDYLYRKDGFLIWVAHDFQPDRLSAWVTERNAFQNTYARPIREARDSELDDKTADAIRTDVMPQFNLRNIGRYEKPVDVEARLPFELKRGLGGESGRELDEVRAARLQPPAPIQIWSVDYTRRLRAQLRRLVQEDPWDMKYGPEATSVHNGLGRNFVVDGTHPDDQPGADFAPALIARPRNWLAPPPGTPIDERPFDISVDAARMDDKTGDKFEL